MGLSSYDSIKDAVTACFGVKTDITGRSYVGGGDINDAFRLDLSNGKKVFVKSNSREKSAFFDAEEIGLEAIAATSAIKTPQLLCKGIDKSEGISFLMMEMMERGQPAVDTWDVFGYELAMMHKADTKAFVKNGKFGFTDDNFIGASKQINDGRDSWIAFFGQCRLEPQFKMASGYFDKDFLRDIIKFMDRLDDILVEPPAPSLLHGDLWSGNVMIGNDGRALLIDPASYVGHAEADLAMTELFGRLPAEFYSSYRRANELQPGYEQRRDIYNLYHLLNHLNLFGRSYLGPVVMTVRNAVR